MLDFDALTSDESISPVVFLGLVGSAFCHLFDVGRPTSRPNFEACARGAVGTATPMGELFEGPVGGAADTVDFRFELGTDTLADAEPNAGTCGGGVADACARRFRLESGDVFRP